MGRSERKTCLVAKTDEKPAPGFRKVFGKDLHVNSPFRSLRTAAPSIKVPVDHEGRTSGDLPKLLPSQFFT